MLFGDSRLNLLLTRLQPYPFEKLRELFSGIKPNPAYAPIALHIGEPKHPTPEFIKRALIDALETLAQYPRRTELQPGGALARAGACRPAQSSCRGRCRRPAENTAYTAQSSARRPTPRRGPRPASASF